MIRREFKRLVREAEKRKPDAAVLIDFPDFNLRLARELHQLGIPVIYYVSPQLWAWRQGRIRQIQKYVRKMLVIFPFEQHFYRERGVEAEYVGHPLADEAYPSISRERFAAMNKLDPAKTWISLLPGSRHREVLLNIPDLLKTAKLLQTSHVQFLLPVASSLDATWISGLVADQGLAINLVRDARAALCHSRAAIVASGTATLEAALIGNPFVMIYRVTPLTYMLGRKLVKLSRFAMPNLIAGREVVPEFVQHQFVPKKVADKVRELLDDGPSRRQMIADLAEVQRKLQSQDDLSASDRAADAILASLGDKT
jgi:lipid-A-disaccharide synthase